MWLSLRSIFEAFAALEALFFNNSGKASYRPLEPLPTSMGRLKSPLPPVGDRPFQNGKGKAKLSLCFCDLFRVLEILNGRKILSQV